MRYLESANQCLNGDRLKQQERINTLTAELSDVTQQFIARVDASNSHDRMHKDRIAQLSAALRSVLDKASIYKPGDASYEEQCIYKAEWQALA